MVIVLQHGTWMIAVQKSLSMLSSHFNECASFPLVIVRNVISELISYGVCFNIFKNIDDNKELSRFAVFLVIKTESFKPIRVRNSEALQSIVGFSHQQCICNNLQMMCTGQQPNLLCTVVISTTLFRPYSENYSKDYILIEIRSPGLCYRII